MECLLSLDCVHRPEHAAQRTEGFTMHAGSRRFKIETVSAVGTIWRLFRARH